MKRIMGLCIGLAAMLAVPVWAEVPLLEKVRDVDSGGNYRTGAFRWWNNPTPLGRILLPSPGIVYGSGHGFAFDGPTEVSSFAYQAGLVDGRLAPVSGFDVYANGKLLGKVQLANTDVLQPNVPILAVDVNGALKLDRDGAPIPITITANWLTLVPTGIHAFGESGAVQLYFNGTPCDASLFEANLNLRGNGGFRAGVPTCPALSGYGGSAAAAVDGQLFSGSVSHATNLRNDSKSTEQMYLTVEYTQPVDVLSVGIALMAEDNNRRIPRFVYITGDDDVTRAIELDPTLLFYNRYDLEVPLTQTMSLTITFPDPSDSAKWWGGETLLLYGLTEFQAFAQVTPSASFTAVAVPEPMTMALLALGGLAMLRRRK